MTASPLQKKLRLQPGFQALVINGPEHYFDLLGSLPDDVDFSAESGENLDFVHLFVKNKQELDSFIDKALAAIRHDGLLWISYPKGSSGFETDINRDIIWEHLKPKGIRPVTQVSVDATWSAMRFRPTDKVGK